MPAPPVALSSASFAEPLASIQWQWRYMDISSCDYGSQQSKGLQYHIRAAIGQLSTSAANVSLQVGVFPIRSI